LIGNNNGVGDKEKKRGEIAAARYERGRGNRESMIILTLKKILIIN
jgi:hypothetical protein